jgi:hypothetical protein
MCESTDTEASPTTAAAGDADRRTGDERILVVVAAPFRQAARLRAFIEAVRRLAGVLDLLLLDFRHGALSLAVTYTDSEPLARRLHTLAGFEMRIDEDGGRIMVLLDEAETET